LLRQVLIEAAHRLIRHDDYWSDMASRLRAQGKKTCVIVAAVANRWIRKLFYQMVKSSSSDSEASGFLRHRQESTFLKEILSDAETRRLATSESSVQTVLPSVLP